MNKAIAFHQRVTEELKEYNNSKVSKYFEGLSSGDGRSLSYAQEVNGIYNGLPTPFYFYMACAVRLSETIDAVELGADRGVSAIFIQSEIPGDVYSVNTDIGSDNWRYVPKEMTKIKKVLGSSIVPSTLANYDLSKAKFWLIDSEHTDDHFAKEIELYKNRWEAGTVVMCDDIRSTYRPWEKLPYDKFEDKVGMIHGNGVGLFIV